MGNATRTLPVPGLHSEYHWNPSGGTFSERITTIRHACQPTRHVYTHTMSGPLHSWLNWGHSVAINWELGNNHALKLELGVLLLLFRLWIWIEYTKKGFSLAHQGKSEASEPKSALWKLGKRRAERGMCAVELSHVNMASVKIKEALTRQRCMNCHHNIITLTPIALSPGHETAFSLTVVRYRPHTSFRVHIYLAWHKWASKLLRNLA